MRIQIVEDEGVVALDIRRHLESFGYSVVGIHSSGEEALEKFEEEVPDLVLMDIRLQGEMDGIETARIIKEKYRIPVIMLTAYADEKTVERAKFIEPFGYIIKPFEERELRTNIEMAFFRHRLEKKLQKSEERYRSFFEDDLSGDFVADPTGLILDCNHAFLNYFGFDSREQALQSNFDTFFYDDLQSEQFWSDLYQNHRLEFYELELKRTDGSYISLLANLVASSDNEGNITEIKGYLIDITRRKELEQQLRQSQKLEAIGRLAGGVAHDFNNILTVILGYSTILREKMQGHSSDIESEVHGIEEAAHRASSLTRQLLAFSRRQVLKPKQVSMNSLIQNLDKMMSRLISENIRLSNHLEADPDTVWIDPSQVEQVLVNLIVNARDAMPRGGSIRIKTGNKTIQNPTPSPMGEIPKGSYITVEVQDTGNGIEPHLLKMIFEPFFTTKEEEKGTGLGLSTVYGIVKQSNGYLRVDSKLNQGSNFTIYFPLSLKDDNQVGESTDKQLKLKGNERILVVEDEENVRNLVRRILKLYGYQVYSASVPEQALELLSSESVSFDLVVTDMVMPRIGGLELSRKAKKMRPELKFLYMSGYPQGKDAVAEKGIDPSSLHFIPKPFSPEKFVRAVRSILDEKR
ncbi:MAG TPA: hybrid sensor histidine kinase/response regulator [Sediminispirochaeta sp.]|nr:hybrid sensor histidine kinase/response regulator [Sediminispirochaeta sp.]